MYARRRFARRRPARRPFVRRTFRRNAPARRNRPRTVSTNSQYYGRFNYSRGRRLSRRAYNRQLFRASGQQQHWRSASTLAATVTTGAVITESLVGYVPFQPNSFWTASGGLIESDKDFTGDIYCRGGISKLSLNNSSAGTIRVRFWKVRTTSNGDLGSSLPITAVVNAWDPSLVTDFQRYFRFRDSTDILLRPNQTYQQIAKLRSEKIDQSMFNAENTRDFWVFMYSAVDDTSGLNLDVQTDTNMSFTADATTA